MHIYIYIYIRTSFLVLISRSNSIMSSIAISAPDVHGAAAARPSRLAGGAGSARDLGATSMIALSIYRYIDISI